jgi:hypothetical protein
MSEFSETVKDSKVSKPRVTFSSDFIRITEDHQTTVRVLDAKPEIRWSHWIPPKHHAFPNVNASKGISIICPGLEICPICLWNKEQKSSDPKTKDLLRARKIYTFNVLDRTPVITCTNCEAEHYEMKGAGYAEECNCGASLTDVEPAPRNKVQIMQKGIRIVDQLIAFEEEPDLGDVSTYDIKMDTRGKGGDAMTTCIPKQKTDLDLAGILGEEWETKKYDIKQTVAPLVPEQIMKILEGESYYNVAGSNKE